MGNRRDAAMGAPMHFIADSRRLPIPDSCLPTEGSFLDVSRAFHRSFRCYLEALARGLDTLGPSGTPQPVP
jgi:hypothetical protein